MTSIQLSRPRAWALGGAALLASFAGPLAIGATAVQAKAGDVITYGIITSMPAGGGAGTWVIGGKTFTATARTQFDTVEGPLAVGLCAKVKERAGAVKEIDSEPGDCD